MQKGEKSGPCLIKNSLKKRFHHTCDGGRQNAHATGNASFLQIKSMYYKKIDPAQKKKPSLTQKKNYRIPWNNSAIKM